MTMAEINQLTPGEFVARVGWVFEESPWVAERAESARPFDSLETLCEALTRQVTAASEHEQLALLQSHPDLGARARVSPASAREQSLAGLDGLTQAEYDRLLQLNAAWKRKFGFPFLYAVKGADKYAIMEALERRLKSSREREFAEALAQVFRIARFRLGEIVT